MESNRRDGTRKSEIDFPRLPSGKMQTDDGAKLKGAKLNGKNGKYILIVAHAEAPGRGMGTFINECDSSHVANAEPISFCACEIVQKRLCFLVKS